MESERNYKGHLTILAVNIIFGLNTPISKTLMPDTVTPFTLNYLRAIGAAVLFWIASVFIKTDDAPQGSEYLKLMGAGLLAAVFNQFLFVKGLDTSSPVTAAIIVSLTPIITMVLAAIILREPISGLKASGVLLGLSGALVLILGNTHSKGQGNTLMGNMMCILSGLSYALYLTLCKPLIMRHHPITLMKWMFLFSAIVTIPFCWNDPQATAWQSIGTSQWLRIGYVVGMATFTTYLLIPVAQKRLRPTTLSMYNYVQPIIACIVAVWLGLDTFGLKAGIATAMVFVGVFMVTQSKSKEK